MPALLGETTAGLLVDLDVPAGQGRGPGRVGRRLDAEGVRGPGLAAVVDVDVLDPAVMPAVDAPDDGGIAFAELEQLISGFVGSPDCLGMQLTVFDPDYDPDGGYARELVGSLVTAMSPLLRTAGPDRGVPVVMPAQRTETPSLPEQPVEITRVPAPTRRSGGRRPKGSADRTG